MMRKYCRAVTLSLLISTSVFIACNRSADDAAPETPVSTRVAPQSPTLVEDLLRVKGSYTWRQDLKRYEYSARDRLETIVSAVQRDDAAVMLIDCIDNSMASNSTLEGMPVSVGMICYEALTQLAYYEPTAPNGDVAASWPGYVSPHATPVQMKAAKEAWRRAINEKHLIFQ